MNACEKFPKSPNYWSYRFQAAQTWQNQSLNQKALEEYRKIAKEAPDAAIRTSAIQQAWNVEGKYFYMHVNQSFTTGQEPQVQVQLSKIDKILFRAEHIKFDAVLEKRPDGRPTCTTRSKVGKEGRRELKEWTPPTPTRGNNHRRTSRSRCRRPSGVYVVSGEHDGIVMTVPSSSLSTA